MWSRFRSQYVGMMRSSASLLCCFQLIATESGASTVTKHIINCDETPFFYQEFFIHPEDQIASRITGQYEFDRKKVELFLAKDQKIGNLTGSDLKTNLHAQSVLPAAVLRFLLDHPELIPQSWKGQHVYFWGTIFRDSKGKLIVCSLFWYSGVWMWGINYVNFPNWGINSPAAVLKAA